MQALILLDVQKDFEDDGALPVPGTRAIIPYINRVMDRFPIVVAVHDWHPANHVGFAANHPGKVPGDTIEINKIVQQLWPIHCVQHTYGASFCTGLNTKAFDRVFSRGFEPKSDGHSGFFDSGRLRQTGLHAYLKTKQITHITIMGVGLEYCVKYTAIDATELGYHTYVDLNGCSAANLEFDDIPRALRVLKLFGVRVTGCLSTECLTRKTQ